MNVSPLKTTAFRQAVLYGALFTVGAAVLLSTIYILTRTVLVDESESVIAAEIAGLHNRYQREGLPGLRDELGLRGENWRRSGAVYLLVDAEFNKLAGNLSRWPFDAIPTGRWPEFEIEASLETTSIRHPVRASVLRLPHGAHLLVGTVLTEQRAFLARFRVATGWAIALTALLATAGGYWLARRLSTRVLEISQVCESIIGGNLAGRLPLSGSGDEFDALGMAVNRVLSRLDEQTRVLRTTFDSAAHDLRAPLYRIRGRVEDLLRSAATFEHSEERLDAVLRDLDTVQRTLTVLLQIAEAGSTILDGNECVDLSALVRELVELYEPVARERQLTLTASITGNVTVRGRRQLLAQAVTNLIENGLKYVPAGGTIDAAVTRTGGRCAIVVADSGPGIAAADRQRAIQPFIRLESALKQSGSGLGLALVAAIARLHNAELELLDPGPEAGSGLRVSLTFAVYVAARPTQAG